MTRPLPARQGKYAPRLKRGKSAAGATLKHGLDPHPLRTSGQDQLAGAVLEARHTGDNMPSSHDLNQDRHLADLDAEIRAMRKQRLADLRLINKIAKDLNARLAALTPQSEQRPQVEKRKPSRRKTPGKGATVK